MKIIAGSNSKEIAHKVASLLYERCVPVTMLKFNDGELEPTIEESIRNEQIFIIQSTNSPAENIMELLLLIDACKRASAKQINIIIPYFGYGRQDRQDDKRKSVGSKLIIDIIEKACTPVPGRIATFDLHTMQTQAYSNFPFEHLHSHTIFREFLINLKKNNLVIASPDVGGIKRAKLFLKYRPDAEMVMIDKVRSGPNKVKSFTLIGEVKDKDVLIVDDMIDTGGTLFGASDYLTENGARSVRAVVTHPLFLTHPESSIKKILKNFDKSSLKELITSDTILHSDIIKNKNIKVFSTAPLIAEFIRRIITGDSISAINSVD
jgi:ribose-phosphate pyrophosphokinase